MKLLRRVTGVSILSTLLLVSTLLLSPGVAQATTAFDSPGALNVATNKHDAVEPRQDVSLNGDKWQFRPIKMPFAGWELDDTRLDRSFIRDAIDAVPASEWESWKDVRVPMAWNSIEEFDFPDFWHYVHKGEYLRTFDVPASFDGKTVSIDFAGVNWKTWVYVNDTLVHAPGFESEDFTHDFALRPFSVDITDAVEPGSTGNTLRVVVQDITANFLGESPKEYSVPKYPMGVRGEYWNRNDGAAPRTYHDAVSGLFRDVTLSAVPRVHVADVLVRPNQDAQEVTVELTLANESSTAQRAIVKNRVEEWKTGKKVLSFDESPKITIPAGGTATVTLTQSWTDFQLWWPDDPVLYNMVTSLKIGKSTVDTSVQRFGVREIRAVADADTGVRGVYVNDVRTALFGESIEYNIIGKGVDGIVDDGLTFNGSWAMTRSYFSQVIDVAKSMNINVLRIHRGWALNKELVEIADEKGMMLIAENPIVLRGWEAPIQDQYRENALSAVLDMAKTYRNNPSIVIWSVSNENPAYNDDLIKGMKEGYAGRPAVNPDIQLVSANAETDTVKSGGYRGGYLTETTEKTWFTYEENASYLKLTNESRRDSVIDSMRIFRQQRMSLGYDAKIALSFYNFQKVFALPENADPAQARKVEIPWTDAEINGPGYHAKYMWQSIFNPYTTPATVNTMTEFGVPSEELWADSYSPVAVFDKGWVDSAMNGLDLKTPFQGDRQFYVFNSDLKDRSTAVTVNWTLLNDETGATIQTGEFTADVPLGGYKAFPIAIGGAPTAEVSLKLTATKSGVERFQETLEFGEVGAAPAPMQPVPGGDAIVIDNGQDGVSTAGMSTSTEFQGVYGISVLRSLDVSADDYARFTPYIGTAGDYRVFVHVPQGLTGTQRLRLVWDDEGSQQTEADLDVSAPGWVEVPGSPLPMAAGAAGNYVEFIAGGTSSDLVADAVAFQRVGDPLRVTVDQRRSPGNGSTWEYLGRYECAAGAHCSVTLANNADDRVIADAVQFRSGDTVVTVDEDQAATTGSWQRAADKPTSVGGDVIYTSKASPATATITYTPQLPQAGAYDVYATWDRGDGTRRASNAPYTVTSSSTSAPTVGFDDDMSSSAGWADSGTGGSSSWRNGIVRVLDDSTQDYFAIVKRDFVAPKGAFTYEFAGHTETAGSVEVAVRSSEYYVQVVLNHGGAGAGTVTDRFATPYRSFTLDTTVDHTYRVVVAEDGHYDLYVDGAPAWSGASQRGTTGPDVFKIGSEPALVGGVVIGRVRLVEGAQAPAPFVPGGAVNPVPPPLVAASGEGNVAALTFDDGPNGAYTTAVLDYLKANGIRAVFCVTGTRVKQPGSAELLRRMVSEGHLLCNHSATHVDMGGWSTDRLRADLTENLRLIREALGDPNAQVPFYRAPMGSWGASPEVAVALGMQPLAVVNTIKDPYTQDAATLTANLRAALKPGELVLLHDGGGDRSGTIAALRTVVTEKLAEGWRFTLPDVRLEAPTP